MDSWTVFSKMTKTLIFTEIYITINSDILRSGTISLYLILSITISQYPSLTLFLTLTLSYFLYSLTPLFLPLYLSLYRYARYWVIPNEQNLQNIIITITILASKKLSLVKLNISHIYIFIRYSYLSRAPVYLLNGISIYFRLINRRNVYWNTGIHYK